MIEQASILPAGGAAPVVQLSQREKAAVIVRFLMEEGADLSLAALPQDLQAILTTQMGQMPPVDRQTLIGVIAEFSLELEQLGITFPHDLHGAIGLMENQIDPQTADRLRKTAGLRQIRDPWERINALAPTDLQPILAAEGTEVAAVILSRLDTALAAKILGLLPGPRARQIALAVAHTRNVTPEAVERIGFSLLAQMDAEPDRAFATAPEERLGDILNLAAAPTREAVMEDLKEQDAGFAEGVEQAIFTFADLPLRLNGLDVPKLVKAVGTDGLQRAIAHGRALGLGDSAEFLLSNMSARLAANLREDLEGAPPPTPSDGDAAISALLAQVKSLETKGELALIPKSQ